MAVLREKYGIGRDQAGRYQPMHSSESADKQLRLF
jgi:hypothetical protein